MNETVSLWDIPEGESSLSLFLERIDNYPYCQTIRLQYIAQLATFCQERMPESYKDQVAYISDYRVVHEMMHSAELVRKPSGESISVIRAEEGKSLPEQKEALPLENAEDKGTVLSSPEEVVSIANDYMAFLTGNQRRTKRDEAVPHDMQGQKLIDRFIDSPEDGEEKAEEIPLPTEPEHSDGVPEKDPGTFLTEALARIYIQQGKYQDALEITRKLMAHNSKKNSYFADQIRYLEKLILIDKNKQNQIK